MVKRDGLPTGDDDGSVWTAACVVLLTSDDYLVFGEPATTTTTTPTSGETMATRTAESSRTEPGVHASEHEPEVPIKVQCIGGGIGTCSERCSFVPLLWRHGGAPSVIPFPGPLAPVPFPPSPLSSEGGVHVWSKRGTSRHAYPHRLSRVQ